MATTRLTPNQRRAVETAGKSILVSASAGSGKTTVLAERCAHLVCDAPPQYRCDADRLLVLTFTEAAAAEMRSRTIAAIQRRSAARPTDRRLREQAALVSAAQISTIHSFCLWLIRRWFTDLDIDAGATVLDEHEASLLRQETLDEFFDELYRKQPVPTDAAHRLGEQMPGRDDADPPRACRDGPGPLSDRFARLVDSYGLGDDTRLAAFVLDLHAFTGSLADPDRWLESAVRRLQDDTGPVVRELFGELQREIALQVEHCSSLAALAEKEDAGRPYAQGITEYVNALDGWLGELGPALAAPSKHLSSVWRQAAESVRTAINQYAPAALSKRTRGGESDDDGGTAFWSNQLKDIRNGLFKERLRTRFALFSVEDSSQILHRIAPFVGTIAELVRVFRERYDRRKRALGVLDFADLERLAYRLLTEDNDPTRPSTIARSLHERFAYVLVDEYQDISPIQEAIITLASQGAANSRPTGTDPASAPVGSSSEDSRPSHQRNGNLFVVGDMKQSIYRFRLAEPAILGERMSHFRSDPTTGEVIPLHEDFRSRPKLLRAVNHVFRVLMHSGDEISYDEDAELRPGSGAAPQSDGPPVDIHLLESHWRRHKQDGDEAGRNTAEQTGDERGDPPAPEDTAVGDAARWSSTEREAYAIGLRIREWMEAGERINGRPIAYRDVAVLLRRTRVDAERLATMLNSMDIPAFADVGGSLFGELEVLDVLAVLQILDNIQQDIPLAATLRGGVFAEHFNEDELTAIRLFDRAAPFHQAVLRYAGEGTNRDLRTRLAGWLTNVKRYREEARRRPLADLLSRLLEREGYAAYVAGMPGAELRQANLNRLHDLARRFGSFRRQGLHRFLAFWESLAQGNRELPTASPLGESEDVVRIMSIHRAKGLEFPIVFVAGLGGRFNLSSRDGRMIYDRTARIGLRATDREQLIEFPSAAHHLVALQTERTTRAEEKRILYVAMTRARERLVLVGSAPEPDRIEEQRRRPPSRLDLTRARSPLDWILSALSASEHGVVQWAGAQSGDDPLFRVRVHRAREMQHWSPQKRQAPGVIQLRRTAARLEPLPDHEPMAPSDPVVEEVLRRTNYTYPALSVSSVAATAAASAVRSLDSPLEGALPLGRRPSQGFAFPPSKYGSGGSTAGQRRGTLTHRVLQHIDLVRANTQEGLAAEWERLVDEHLLTRDERSELDAGGIEWFLATPLADRMRSSPGLRREFSFIASEHPGYFDPDVQAQHGDFVLVRGVVDAVLPANDGLELIDFKTEQVTADQLAGRTERYRPQMEIYARCMAKLWDQPVTACRLVFLHAREIADLNP